MKIEEIEQYFYDLAIRAGYSEYEADLIAREIMDITKDRSDERYYRVFREIIDPLVEETDGWQECD